MNGPQSANPIEIQSNYNSLNSNQLHEIRFLLISFKLHSYVVWNPIKIAFQEICFGLIIQIGFSLVFVKIMLNVNKLFIVVKSRVKLRCTASIPVYAPL